MENELHVVEKKLDSQDIKGQSVYNMYLRLQHTQFSSGNLHLLLLYYRLNRLPGYAGLRYAIASEDDGIFGMIHSPPRKYTCDIPLLQALPECTKIRHLHDITHYHASGRDLAAAGLTATRAVLTLPKEQVTCMRKLVWARRSTARPSKP